MRGFSSMFLAEEAAKSTATFSYFDIFMIVFTLLIAWGLFRLVKAKDRNKFALGFTTVCLLVFLAADFLMVLSWMGELRNFQDMIFGS